MTKIWFSELENFLLLFRSPTEEGGNMWHCNIIILFPLSGTQDNHITHAEPWASCTGPPKTSGNKTAPSQVLMTHICLLPFRFMWVSKASLPFLWCWSQKKLCHFRPEAGTRHKCNSQWILSVINDMLAVDGWPWEPLRQACGQGRESKNLCPVQLYSIHLSLSHPVHVSACLPDQFCSALYPSDMWEYISLPHNRCIPVPDT